MIELGMQTIVSDKKITRRLNTVLKKVGAIAYGYSSVQFRETEIPGLYKTLWMHPTSAFWGAWKADKEAVKAAGWHPFKIDRAWHVILKITLKKRVAKSSK